MRIPSSVFAVGRYVLALFGDRRLSGADERAEKDRVHEARQGLLRRPECRRVRPAGLNITIISANIATDGTITVGYKLTDPKGLPLDLDGRQTPGAVSVSFVMAYIPKGEKQFYSYATRSQTSPITKVTAIQAGADSGGTTQTGRDRRIHLHLQDQGRRRRPAERSIPTATHRIGIYGSRNLTEFDLGTNYDTETLDFVPTAAKSPAPATSSRTRPATSATTTSRFHGGSRRGMELCIMCHTRQTIDPDTGNTVDMKVMVHKIHMGKQLPSVQAGKPYQIIGNSQSVSDWSTVVCPPTRGAASSATSPKTGAAQADAWLKNPSRAACGSCHDNVNFATGADHVNLPQVDDNQCTQCHIPQGELEFDASITDAHIVDTEAPSVPA